VSRTDTLLEVIRAELEAHRSEIDRDDGLSTVGLIIKMDARGLPGLVIWRPESQRKVRLEVRVDRNGQPMIVPEKRTVA
jgi:hypothetical protein